MNSKPRFFHHHNGDVVVTYQIKTVIESKPIKDVPCPCCEGQMIPLADIQQFGIFDDKYNTFFACEDCAVVVEFRYNIATYALVSKREQKALGFLPLKGGPAKPGSGA